MEWPGELIHVSDRHACESNRVYDERAKKERQLLVARDEWVSKRVCGVDDAGIVAFNTPPARASVWPVDAPRTSNGSQSRAGTGRGFLVATCASTNANEVGLYRGGACSRSHQTFMNTTRKGTGRRAETVREH